MKLLEFDQQLRPREKALRYGVQSLSDIELLAVILRIGTKGKSVIELATEVFNEMQSLSYLTNIHLEQIRNIKGISSVKVLELACIGEISKRIAFQKVKNQYIVDSAKALGVWLNQEIGFQDYEQFMVIFLDTKNQIITYKVLFVGTLNASLVHPREIFKEAFRLSANKIILAHNHPSGNVEYSQADKDITLQLVEIGKLCGISVLDHVIVGKNNVFSLREHQIVDFEK